MGRLIATLLGSLSALLIAAECQGGSRDDAGSAPLQVRGLITEVRARSPLDLELLQVTDERNTAWDFRPGAEGVLSSDHDYTPSHLRQHMVQGMPIVVAYREKDGVLMIVGISE